jgi:hypothetical protein
MTHRAFFVFRGVLFVIRCVGWGWVRGVKRNGLENSRCVIGLLVSGFGFGELGRRVGVFGNIFKDSLRDEVEHWMGHSLYAPCG